MVMAADSSSSLTSPATVLRTVQGPGILAMLGKQFLKSFHDPLAFVVVLCTCRSGDRIFRRAAAAFASRLLLLPTPLFRVGPASAANCEPDASLLFN